MLDIDSGDPVSAPTFYVHVEGVVSVSSVRGQFSHIQAIYDLEI